MSEDDRAAKAARAKALLKKRQQQKASNVASPSTPEVATPSRTSTPVAEHAVQDGVRDSGELFSDTKIADDTSWLTSLPRMSSFPQQQRSDIHTTDPVNSLAPQFTQTHLARVADIEKTIEILSKQNESLTLAVSRLKGFETAAQQANALLEDERIRMDEFKAKLRKEIEDEQRTVSLLVSEKAHLTSQLQILGDAESRAQVLEDFLEAERGKCANLDEIAARLQIENSELTGQAEQFEVGRKELADQNKELERQLQIASVSAADKRKEADGFQRRLRDLEEQIQADDRVERLETSLKHNQDRAVELEFQLTKTKQAYTSLKIEREKLESKLQEFLTKEPEWTSQMSTLDSQLASTHDRLSKIEAERNHLSEENILLQQQSKEVEGSIKGLREELARANSAMTTMTRQMQHTQTELKNALRRAEDAENNQKSLQSEGTNLMLSLDEMRPKIVELTGVKLDLLEKADSLERALKSRDLTIAQLENELGEVRDNLEHSDKIWKDKVAQQEKRLVDCMNGTADMQKAYGELQEELDTALASLRNLEAQRANHPQELRRHIEEIEHLSHLSQSQAEELDTFKHELVVAKKAHDEEQEFLERAQNEIEALRSELDARGEEIVHLREFASAPTSAIPPSLDEEMLNSLRQQHALELSAATSQIRALENTIFDKDSAIHGLQKEIKSYEEQMDHTKPSPRLPTRPISRTSNYNDSSRLSSGAHRPSLPSPLARTVFDEAMTPETFHKRKVSLSMLKARMESEAKVQIGQSSSRALSPVQSNGKPSRPSSVVGHNHRPQFLDETHVFWCHACSGDLVIL